MRWILQTLIGVALLLPTYQAFSVEPVEPPTMVVLPLEVSNEGRYAYLNRVIDQMLLTRLSQTGAVKARGSEMTPGDRQKIRSLLQSGKLREAADALGADWFVDGMMYSLPGGLQLNVSLYSAGGGAPVTLSAMAEDEDAVFDAVGGLSKDIADAVAAATTVVEQRAEAAARDDGLSGFETPHPERDYKKGLYSGSALIAGQDGDIGFESRGMRKSDAIPLSIVSLASGDLDGDGVNDLVVASQSRIRIFAFNDLTFTGVAEYDFSPRMKIHVINIGDHDGSGTMKLYVSGNDGRFASSAILGWNGSETLQPIRQAIPWYLRPLEMPDGKTMLIGQQTSDRPEDGFLQSGVFALSIDPESSRIVKGARLMLPEGTNVFDFVQADLNGDAAAETVVIDRNQKLLVYDLALNLIWVSSANYGGSRTYFGPSRDLTDRQDMAGLTEAQQDRRRLVWIPGRLDVKDITGDGLPEVVVVTNNIGIDRYLENTRFYDGGAVACLGWYGQGLAELWQTSHIEGYVADYFFDEGEAPAAAADGTVLNRLYVAQIPATSLIRRLIPGSAESRILAYEMEVRKNRDEAPQK